MSISNSLQWLASIEKVSIIFAIGLMLSGIGKPPLGYLHSWNQITTLAMIQSIAEDNSNLFSPQDVTTLLSWRSTDEQKKPNVTAPNFTVFEEFPLYHLIAAKLSTILGSEEKSAHILSIFFWLVGLAGFRKLIKVYNSNRELLSISTIVYCSSFPVLYYGQAIMSDMAMTACLICFVAWVSYFSNNYSRSTELAAAAILTLATLFKSYAAVFVVLIPFINFGNSKTSEKISSWMISILAITPVILWHIYSSTSSGHLETQSHNINLKLQTIFSIDFFLLQISRMIKYVGEINFAVILFAVVTICKRREKLSNIFQFPCWLKWYFLALSIYLIFCADKLSAHNYYHLPAALLYFYLTSIGYYYLWIKPVYNQTYFRQFLSIALILSFVPTSFSFAKALRLNTDILECSKLVAAHSSPEDLIAVMSTGNRYNSIHYYSKRKGFSVQETHFQISEYRNAGAKILVINMTPAEMSTLDSWLSPQLQKMKLLANNTELSDIKNNPRICKIYELLQY